MKTRSKRVNVGPRSKKQSQKLHAKRRAKERFGLELNRETHIFLLSKIHNKKSICIERQSVRIALYLLELRDERLVRVVYDALRNVIVTVLPPRYADFIVFSGRNFDQEEFD